MDGIVAGSQKGLRFQNANGGDLDIFPGFMLMRAKGETDYALVDLRELRLDVEPIAFIESENRASVHMHQQLGFIHVGQMRQVGCKFGR